MDLTSYLIGRKSSGGGGGDIDWSLIGYSGTPQYIIDGFDYAKEIQEYFNDKEGMADYYNDKKLIYFPKIDHAIQGVRFNKSSVQYVPELIFHTDKYVPGFTCEDAYNLMFLGTIDFSNVSNCPTDAFRSGFRNCYSLRSAHLILPKNVKNLDCYSLFSNCNAITDIIIENVGSIDASNSYEMFRGCNSLKNLTLIGGKLKLNSCSYLFNSTGLEELPQLDTSECANFSNFCDYCFSLVTIPAYDCSFAVYINTVFSNSTKIENFGGFINLGKAYLTTRSANYNYYTLDLSPSKVFTHESLMNVINGLYDIATAGVQTQKLILGSTNLAKLTTEEIAIATNKGWTVS